MKNIAQPPIVLQSLVVCPYCGHAADEEMATDSCRYFYECLGCRALLCPKPGDCCVFCSYGSVKCPPVQSKNGCSIRVHTGG